MQWLNKLLNLLIEYAGTQEWMLVVDMLIYVKEKPFLPLLILVGLLIIFTPLDKLILMLFGKLSVWFSVRLLPATIDLEKHSTFFDNSESFNRKQRINELRQLGFSRGFDYSYGKLSYVELSTFFKDDICVALYQQNDVNWYDIVALFTDGSRLTLSTNLNAKYYPDVANQTFIKEDMWQYTLDENLTRFESKLKQINQSKATLNVKNFKQVFESVYAENMTNAKQL